MEGYVKSKIDYQKTGGFFAIIVDNIGTIKSANFFSVFSACIFLMFLDL